MEWPTIPYTRLRPAPHISIDRHECPEDNEHRSPPYRLSHFSMLHSNPEYQKKKKASIQKTLRQLTLKIVVVGPLLDPIKHSINAS